MLDVPEYLLRNTILLQKPEDLTLHLGLDIPPKYGGNGRSLSEFNCIDPLRLDFEGQKNMQNAPVAEGKGDRSTGEKETGHGQASNAPKNTDSRQSTPSPEEPELRLIYSEDIGLPTIIWILKI